MFEKHCITCNAVLKSDEIPLYKKMVNRGATEYMCIPCLAKKLRVTEQSLCEAIERFREMGCTLF